MARCRRCGEPFRPNLDRPGAARCRRCHEPLYEDPRLSMPRTGEGDNFCAVHSQNPSVGTCQRCGNFLCAVCRTRWREQVLCTACINRAVELKETAPQEARVQWLQSLFACLLGVGCWGMTVLAIVMVGVLMSGGTGSQVIALLLLLGCFLFSALAAMTSIGLGASAVRARGNHMILATIGLILGGLHMGMLIGLFTYSIWQN